MSKITNDNRQEIIEKYINAILASFNLNKESNLYEYQRLLSGKNAMSNEILEQEIISFQPEVLNSYPDQ